MLGVSHTLDSKAAVLCFDSLAMSVSHVLEFEIMAAASCRGVGVDASDFRVQ